MSTPTRDDAKVTYQAYQRAAQALATASMGQLRVPTYPEVQMTEEGAFVEAYVWIPKEALGGADR